MSKKLSGYQNRKRKADHLEEDAKQRSLMTKFFVKEPEPSTSSMVATDQNDLPCVLTFAEYDTPPTESQVQLSNTEIEVPSNLFSYTDDPCTWTTVNDALRTMLVSKGPVQVADYTFPLDDHRRRFTTANYSRRLANGDTVKREWLVYSKGSNSVYCFCCKLFGKTNASKLGSVGFRDWINLSAVLSSHEHAEDHLRNFINWKELEIRLKTDSTIDSTNLKNLQSEEKYWRDVLLRLIGLIRVLGTQNLAFRGTNEHLYEPNNGNFLKFVELLALFDPIMAQHTRRCEKKDRQPTYLGKSIQNEIISLLAAEIKNIILSEVLDAKYYSIMLDCTPDSSRKEQLTIILRYVKCSQQGSEIVERFIGFVEAVISTGENLAKTAMEALIKQGFSINKIRGQGYDNGSNMKGCNKGVQRRILDINPRAFYLPCGNHTLNLSVNDAASATLEGSAFFGAVQQLFVFFASSTKRWAVLQRHVSLTLKPICPTRCEARIEALKPSIKISACRRVEGMKTRSEAEALARTIISFKFFASLVVWYDILFQVNITSQRLQNKEQDLSGSMHQLDKTKKILNDWRSDEEYNKKLTDARELAESVGIPPTFPTEGCTARLRRVRQRADYEAQDEPIEDPSIRFKVEFYFTVLDIVINSINDRFAELDFLHKTFGILFRIADVSNLDDDTILNQCKTLEQALTVGDDKDLDAQGLAYELKAVARRLEENISPKSALDFICAHGLTDNFPNLFIALKILLTLPVSVASAERSFSKLKLILTYLRSAMGKNRLSDLAIIAIEKKLAYLVELESVVNTFAKIKARQCFRGI